MIFKRRNKPPITERVREFLAPRKGFWRGFGYVGQRMRRLPDSPHRIALGFACGALTSFTPFFGLHFLIAAALAWVVRSNVYAGLLGTIVGNPLTFPFISAGSLWLGRNLLGVNASESDFEAVMHAFTSAFTSLWQGIKSWFGVEPSFMDGMHAFFYDLFLPYIVGGIPLGFVCGFITYWILLPIVSAYQKRRRKKFAERAHQAKQKNLGVGKATRLP